MVTHKLLRSPSQAKKVPHKPKSASQAIKVPLKPIKCPQATKVLHRLIKCLTSCRGVRHRPIKCHTSCRGVHHKPIECLTSCRLCMVSFEPRWRTLIFFMKNYKKAYTVHSHDTFHSPQKCLLFLKVHLLCWSMITYANLSNEEVLRATDILALFRDWKGSHVRCPVHWQKGSTAICLLPKTF